MTWDTAPEDPRAQKIIARQDAEIRELRTRLAKVVEAAKQLFTSIETIERQAEVLARRVQDDRPVDTILFECKRTRAALLLAAAQPEEKK